MNVHHVMSTGENMVRMGSLKLNPSLYSFQTSTLPAIQARRRLKAKVAMKYHLNDLPANAFFQAAMAPVGELFILIPHNFIIFNMQI